MHDRTTTSFKQRLLLKFFYWMPACPSISRFIGQLHDMEGSIQKHRESELCKISEVPKVSNGNKRNCMFPLSGSIGMLGEAMPNFPAHRYR